MVKSTAIHLASLFRRGSQSLMAGAWPLFYADAVVNGPDPSQFTAGNGSAPTPTRGCSLSPMSTLSQQYTRPIPASVADLRAIPGALEDDYPDEVGQALLNFAHRHNLEISLQMKEVSVRYYPSEREFFLVVTASAVHRRARSSGLWLPGTVTFSGEGLDLVAQATSWFRMSRDDQWVLGAGVTVSLFNCYTRVKGSSMPEPLWQVDARRLLAQVAMVRSIHEALGDLMYGFYSPELMDASTADSNVVAMVNHGISVGEYRKRQTTQLR